MKSEQVSPTLVMPEDFVSGRRAAQVLGVSESYFRKLICRGEGPPVIKLGKRGRRFSVSSLRAWMMGRESK